MAICITIGRACRIAKYSIHRSQSVRTLQGSLVDLQACRHQRFAVAMDGLDSGSFPRVIWLYHHALQQLDIWGVPFRHTKFAPQVDSILRFLVRFTQAV
jgi:hypothetical protein